MNFRAVQPKKNDANNSEKLGTISIQQHRNLFFHPRKHHQKSSPQPEKNGFFFEPLQIIIITYLYPGSQKTSVSFWMMIILYYQKWWLDFQGIMVSLVVHEPKDGAAVNGALNTVLLRPWDAQGTRGDARAHCTHRMEPQ